MEKCADTFVQLTYSLLPRDRATERYSLQMRQKKSRKASIDPEVYRQQVLAAMSAGDNQRMFYLDGSPPGGQYISNSPCSWRSTLNDEIHGAISGEEESIWLCHPERSEGSLSGERSFAALRMTILNRLRLTRKTSSLKKCIAPCGQ